MNKVTKMKSRHMLLIKSTYKNRKSKTINNKNSEEKAVQNASKRQVNITTTSMTRVVSRKNIWTNLLFGKINDQRS